MLQSPFRLFTQELLQSSEKELQVSCNRTSLRRLSKKKYHIVPVRKNERYASNKNFEIENIIVEVLESDTVTVTFKEPFTEKPNVVANFVTISGDSNVNVYVDSVTKTQAVIKTSSVITGQIHVQAMYSAGCGPSVISPVVIQVPVLGPAVPGGGPVITQPVVIE